MSVLVSVIILFLVMLIQTFLQLSPGVYTLFYHYALGKKSRKKADSLSLFYILGQELFVSTIFFILCTIIFLIDNYSVINYSYLIWVLAGIFIAEAFASLFFYYKKGKVTQLFISRKTAKNLEQHASNVKTKLDAFTLGFFSNLPELIFTLPLYLATILTLINFTVIPRATILITLILAAVLPIFWIFTLYHTDHHLVEITRLRLKLKPAIIIILFICFLSLSALLIIGALNNG